MKKLIITTSWDDGNKFDTMVASLLNKYNLRGTFYIPINYEKKDLSDSELINLSKNFEIGSHSISHSDLTKISENEIIFQLEESKIHLERLLDKEIYSFSYPYGKYNTKTKKILQKTGYQYARTTKYDYINQYGIIKDPFEIKVGCYLSNKENLDNLIKLIKNIKINVLNAIEWETKAKILFDLFLETGGIYHIWGHSWEYAGCIDKLENVFRYISNNKKCLYLTNIECFEVVSDENITCY